MRRKTSNHINRGVNSSSKIGLNGLITKKGQSLVSGRGAPLHIFKMTFTGFEGEGGAGVTSLFEPIIPSRGIGKGKGEAY